MKQSNKAPIALIVLLAAASFIIPNVQGEQLEVRVATGTDLFPIPNLIIPADVP